MSFPRLSRHQKAALAISLALLLWVPQGISSHEHTMVTGHSTFYNGDAYDPCLGSIAGIMRSRVLWFNDQVLVERYGGAGTFIYVTENGAEDPRGRPLYTDGVFYDFVDPNGAHWHIEEAYIAHDERSWQEVNRDPLHNPKPLVQAGFSSNRTYVWIVELSDRPIYDEFAGDDPHGYYNFVTLVDTCKMRRAAYHGNETHDLGSGKLNDQNGHENGADEHEHETFLVNLWVGKRPNVALGGLSTEGAEWQSAWAQRSTSAEANETQDEYGGVLP